MDRKAGGLAAIMAGQPIVKKKRDLRELVKQLIRAIGLHIGLLFACIAYIYIGAIIFRKIEGPNEIRIRDDTDTKYRHQLGSFVLKAEVLRETLKDDLSFNSSLMDLIDEYTEELLKMFQHPIASNYFDSVFYNQGQYAELWTMDAAVLFTSTTMVPVGFGLITPLTPAGRLFLIIYAIIGIPLALVTMSDIGKFFCDATFRFFKESMTAFVIALLSLLFAYPITGGIVINQVSDLSLFESIYYCSITILTVGYGDIGPPIPVIYLILFIVVGVTLVTISVDVVAANGIHHVHYMGRQMGKAKIIAGKMIQMAQKISINKGLGLGMAQLGAFARMGMMINVSSNGGVITQTTRTEQGSEEMEPLKRKSTAFDPELDFDLIDRGVPMGYDCYENSGFGYFDDLENDAFYT